MYQQNISPAGQNVIEILTNLAMHVRERLIRDGATNLDHVPYFAALREIYKQAEPVRTRLLAELRDATFNVASSHEVRVMWNRRRYIIGPAVQSVSLPVALKIIQHVDCENLRPAVSQDEIQPILLHYESFVIKQGDGQVWASKETPKSAVVNGPTYAWLLKIYKSERSFERRWGGDGTRPNIDSIFKAAVPGQAHVKNEPADYHQVSGSVVGDSWRPGPGRPSMPAETVNAALGGLPATPPPPPPPPPPVKG